MENTMTLEKLENFFEKIPDLNCDPSTKSEYDRIFRRYFYSENKINLKNIFNKNTYYKHKRALEVIAKSHCQAILDEPENKFKIQKDDLNFLRMCYGLVENNCLFDRKPVCPIEKPKRKKSKRGSLKNLPSDWIKIFWQQTGRRKKYVEEVAILSLTGVRPEELEIGVQIESNQAAMKLYVTIYGAKRGVDETKGQKWRRIKIDCTNASKNSPEAYLLESTKNVSRIFKCNNKKLLSDYISYWGTKIFGKRQNSLSPYSFRHQFCADLKADSNFDREDIAKLMGHRSDKTQKNYGSAAQGNGGRNIDSVEASDKVRMHEQTRNFPSEFRNQSLGLR